VYRKAKQNAATPFTIRKLLAIDDAIKALGVVSRMAHARMDILFGFGLKIDCAFSILGFSILARSPASARASVVS
jgi:hypothetical protein